MALFNLTQGDINRGKPASTGWLHLEIIAVKDKISETKGSLYTEVQLQVIDDPIEEGIIIYNNFSEKAPGFVKPFVDALNGQDNGPGSYEINEALIGRKIDGFNQHREYNGKKQNSIADWRPYTN